MAQQEQEKTTQLHTEADALRTSLDKATASLSDKDSLTNKLQQDLETIRVATEELTSFSQQEQDEAIT